MAEAAPGAGAVSLPARPRHDHIHRTLVERAQVVFFETDERGRWTFLNPAWQALTGRDPAASLGESFLDLVPHEDRPAIVARLVALYEGRTDACQQETRFRATDGTLRWAMVNATLLRGDDGAFRGTIGIIWDVHDRKSAELAVAEANARVEESRRLLTIAEGVAHVGHWRADLATRSLFWSDEVYRIHGREPGTPIDAATAEAARHPEDRAALARAVEDALAGGGGYDVTGRIVRPDGGIRHIVTRGQAEFGADGSVVGIFGIVQDVTRQAEAEAALRDSESRHRLLAEHATDIIFRLDRKRRFLYVSPAVATVTGFQPDVLIGEDPVTAMHPADRDGVIALLDGLWDGRTVDGVIPYRTIRADGSYRWLEASVRLVAEPDGGRAVVGVSRDISDRKRFEDELVEARAIAESAAAEARLLAETDELTGLASRRMFLHRLTSDIATARRARQALALAMFDIDYFKRINDHFGHALGDAVLIDIAETARAGVRGGDLVGRLGGEEFAVIMPGTGADTALMIGERLRHAVEVRATDESGLPPVTISIGVAALAEGQDATQLLAAADAALYRAKHAGRNQLCLAG